MNSDGPPLSPPPSSPSSPPPSPPPTKTSHALSSNADLPKKSRAAKSSAADVFLKYSFKDLKTDLILKVNFNNEAFQRNCTAIIKSYYVTVHGHNIRTLTFYFTGKIDTSDSFYQITRAGIKFRLRKAEPESWPSNSTIMPANWDPYDCDGEALAEERAKWHHIFDAGSDKPEDHMKLTVRDLYLNLVDARPAILNVVQTKSESIKPD